MVGFPRACSDVAATARDGGGGGWACRQPLAVPPAAAPAPTVGGSARGRRRSGGRHASSVMAGEGRRTPAAPGVRSDLNLDSSCNWSALIICGRRAAGCGVPLETGERSQPLHSLAGATPCRSPVAVSRPPPLPLSPLHLGDAHAPSVAPPRRRHHAARRGGCAPPSPALSALCGRWRAAAFAASPVGWRLPRSAPAAAPAAAAPALHRLACPHRLPCGRGLRRASPSTAR